MLTGKGVDMKHWAMLMLCGAVAGTMLARAAVKPPPATPPPPKVWPGPAAWPPGMTILPGPPPEAPPRHTVYLKLEVLPKVLTPQFEVSPPPPASAVARYWCQLSVRFDTQPAWTDELEVRCYALLKPKLGTGTLTLLKGDVTLVNLARGQHKCDFFVHPSALLRYGEVLSVVVLVSSSDQLVGLLSQPPSAKRWWEDYQPVPGMVLNRNNTPFALINADDFEQVKKTSAAGAR